jgi:hypothetical protein
MKNRFSLFGLALFAFVNLNVAHAQTAPNPAFADGILIPANPSSADNIVLSITNRSCIPTDYTTNRYLVSMAQNNITVRLGDQRTDVICPGVNPPSPRAEIDLGRLPAGNYTVTVIESSNVPRDSRLPRIQNAPFTVTDGRVAKQKPWVNLNYTGMWWDPADPGSGLFIWQDSVDNTLATWFTYGADGKPSWYVFQPKWGFFGTDTLSATELVQTDRKPGSIVSPPGPTSNIVVGTAWLNFLHYKAEDETGELSITFKGQPTRVIKIQRFKP